MLRPEQQAASDKAVEFLVTAGRAQKLLFSSPTGTGKTYVANDIKARTGATLISPTDDILQGFAAKAGITGDKKQLEALGYFTPMRLRNLLLAGSIPQPSALIVDEAHHAEAETYQLIDSLCDGCPAVGLSATCYRGTPVETAEFRKRWGEPCVIITLSQAKAQGYISFPRCDVIPLLDDDVITVRAGEFVVQELESQLGDVLTRLTEMLRGYYTDRYDKATMLALPSVATAEMYAEALNAAGLPAVCVTGETKDREEAFAKCVSGSHVLVQVRVVSEGVDLPIRRLIDLAPTMSPVKWQQLFGRITRPGGEAEYICTNRNLLRHAYLLDGLLPSGVYRKAEESFKGPSSRRSVRAVGFEGLGRFKSEPVPLKNGIQGELIAISSASNSQVHEYAALASPLHSEVIYAERVNERKPDGTRYEKWKRIDGIPELDKAFASVQKSLPVTEAMERFWKNCAGWVGLDPDAELNRRMFVALPVLRDTGRRFL